MDHIIGNTYTTTIGNAQIGLYITGRDTVKVWADGAANPTAVRYNWGMQGFGNLYNAAGLPASCFTTEP